MSQTTYTSDVKCLIYSHVHYFSALEQKAQCTWAVGSSTLLSSRDVRPSVVSFLIFDFSEIAERNSTKLDRKQDLNVLYQVCVFRVDRKNKMAASSSDWLIHFGLLLLGHRSQRLQWPIVITRCPASVRHPSSVRRPLNYLHFRLLLQNRLMDFDETWYGWSTQGPLQVLLFFGQIPPEADPGRGKNRSRGVPLFRKLLLQTGRLQQQTECIAVI